MEAYSSYGHTIVLYLASRTPLCLILSFCLMKHRDLFALDMILLICILKFKLVGRSTPRYLAEETLSRGVLCIV